MKTKEGDHSISRRNKFGHGNSQKRISGEMKNG
jgi:hypothetical protein